MIRRIFSLIFKLIVAAIVVFLLTAVWIVFDGLNDSRTKADVALVTGHAESSRVDTSQPRLDRVMKLYHDGEFPFIIVSASPGAPDQSTAMAGYLERRGIPANVILESRQGENTQDTARDVAGIMKSRRFQSVMIVADYYHITRTRLALNHEGITEIQKAHVGTLRKEDALKIGREVVALFAYVGKVYLLPAAEKACLRPPPASNLAVSS